MAAQRRKEALAEDGILGRIVDKVRVLRSVRRNGVVLGLQMGQNRQFITGNFSDW